MVSKWLRRTAVRRVLFAGLVVLLTATIGWLGWRVLALDQQLASKRTADERDLVADQVVVEFNRRLAKIERDLDAALSRREFTTVSQEAGAILVRIASDVVVTSPENVLVYYPQLPPRQATPEADAVLTRAHTALRNGNPTAALDAYSQLERFGDVPVGDVVGGIPAALVAHYGALTVHQRQGNTAGRRDAALALRASLQSGRWHVSDATYDFLDLQIRDALPATPEIDDRRAFADAVAWLWRQRTSDASFPPSGRKSLVFPSAPTVLVWRSSPEATVAWIGNRRPLSDVWIPGLRSVIEPRRARVALSTPEGESIVGSMSADDRGAVRVSSETLLPWRLQVSTMPDMSADGDRQRLLLAGIAVLFGLIIAGAWVIERTIARELAVADLQSDFVSAVSHEFRTPLTTLCQLSEMLMRDRVASADDRRQYYQLLHGESHRLRRLVETLLNFGRLEAGRMDFRFADVDVDALVRKTVDEFSSSRQAREHRVDVSIDSASMTTRGDAEVLKTIVWNLLENAAKYLPECDTIWVTVQRQGNEVALTIRDRGAGIPAREQRQVFEKFVRGAGARASGVGGTGVGLAMAKRMVDAHGGVITVKSQPGVGSAFTVMLPLVESTREPKTQRPEPKFERLTTG